MAIREMPLKEKYDKLYDFLALFYAASYAFNKEQGTVDKWPDYLAKVMGKMMPRFTGSVFKLMKVLSPSRTFKQTVNQFMYVAQMEQPLSDLELSWVSNHVAVWSYKNCEMLRRVREVVKKAGLNIEPREVCKAKIAMNMSSDQIAKKLGIYLSCEFKRNGCTWIMEVK